MMAQPDPMSTPFAEQVIRDEFAEMPGMRLTLRQAARLWDLSELRCRCLLDGLVADGFLARDANDRYARRSVLHTARRARGRTR